MQGVDTPTAVTTPVTALTVAQVLLLLHVPPEGEPTRVDTDPLQIESEPEIAGETQHGQEIKVVLSIVSILTV